MKDHKKSGKTRRIRRRGRRDSNRYRKTPEPAHDLAGMLDNLLEGCQIVSHDWRYLYVNEAVTRNGRRTKSELLNHSMMEMYPGIESTEMFAVLKQCMEKRIPRRMENEFTFPDGTTGWFILEIQPVPEGILILSIDITEHKRAEEERREVEDKLLALHGHALQLRSASSIDEIVNSTLDAIEFALGFNVADFYLAETNYLKARGARGTPLGFQGEALNGPGLVAKAARSQITIRVSDTRREPDYVDRMGFDWIKTPTGLSELVVPVIVDGGTVAVLNVENAVVEAFSDRDQMLLEALAAQVAAEMERLKHLQKLEMYSKHLEALVEERTGKLAESEGRYRSIVRNIPAIMWAANRRGDTTFITPNVQQVLGRSPEEIYAGHQAWIGIHPDDKERVNQAYSALFTNGSGFNVEYRYQRPDGKLIWLHDRATVVYEKDGIEHTDGVTTDITERKQIEEELRAAIERLDYVVSSNPAVIQLGKPLPDGSDFISAYLSQSVASLLGFEAEELIGQSGSVVWQSRVPPDDLRRYKSEMPLLWRDGHHSFEYRFQHKDGSIRWIHEENKVIRDSEGQVLDVIGYYTDETDRKKLEEELLKSQRLAAIGETTRMVGHDLRNPLQGIAGATGVLRKHLGSNADEITLDMLDVLEKDVTYSNKIITDLFDYSRQIQITPVETELKPILAESLQMAPAPSNVTVEDQTGNLRIKVDPQIQRVFVNLINNSYEAMQNGGLLKINSKISNGTIEISFSDAGPGFTEDVTGRLWKGPVTTKAKGLGLGLAISKRIVEAHGGSLLLENGQERGAVVTVRLPSEPRSGGE